jgi:hypothetical protein
MLNGYEQFILLASKEQQQDGNLESIEFGHSENQPSSILVIAKFFISKIKIY